MRECDKSKNTCKQQLPIVLATAPYCLYVWTAAHISNPGKVRVQNKS